MYSVIVYKSCRSHARMHCGAMHLGNGQAKVRNNIPRREGI